jgi:pilus assembly protein Flp/PilA
MLGGVAWLSRAKGRRMFEGLRRFIRERSGATAVEYGLIAALVSVASVVSLANLGGSISTMYQSASNTIAGTAP